ncbi:acyclic terpene utilization AtuA family protein [Mangrovimonas sp. DI 80]|uniref:acyclic terpene utilization AtuA family protein n=1 Tax=Mangrovimonas sp. DI 80 TaxID=1779330 RepID=UPI0009781DFA|nr:acyclic terpene utilization AtuA family protein [Mangrovimonas sp. DI 80]OMP32835.1 ABC transporter substrate-binding protein [Mangrovimonas sp. DI 80]
MKTIRIGSGAGYGGDRLEPALTLMEQGNLDYICFECLAERTIALAQKEKKANPNKGYNHLLEYRMEKVLSLAYKHKIKVITNMGAANPIAAMEVIANMAKQQELKGLKIAAVLGDNVLENVKEAPHLEILETGQPLSSISDSMISANAYLGVEGIVEALNNGADIIVTGRVADPSLFLAPMVFEFNWQLTDTDKLGKGTMIGHLLECSAQVCGGYFADPPKKIVPNLANIGFPFVEVNEHGDGFISKVKGTGGLINTATCTEQLLYEIHDPSKYFTPDVVADFSKVTFEEIDMDTVQFKDASGHPATNTYKVSVGYVNGFFGEGQISYGGANALARANLAMDTMKQRLADYGFEDLRFDLIGVNSLAPFNVEVMEVPEVRLRVSGRAATAEQAKHIGREVEALYTNGPAGGGGASQKVEGVISVLSVLSPKSDIKIEVVYTNI